MILILSQKCIFYLKSKNGKNDKFDQNKHNTIDKGNESYPCSGAGSVTPGHTSPASLVRTIAHRLLVALARLAEMLLTISIGLALEWIAGEVVGHCRHVPNGTTTLSVVADVLARTVVITLT